MILSENRHVEKGCLMAQVSPTYGPHVIRLGRTAIPPHILYTDPNDPTYGYDDEPHVTLKYGFEPDLSKMNVAKILQGTKPFNIVLKALNLFENDKFDVVKFEVQKCPTLTELRRRCDGYPNNYPWIGDIAVVLMYERVLTSSEIKQISNLYKDKYGY